MAGLERGARKEDRRCRSSGDSARVWKEREREVREEKMRKSVREERECRERVKKKCAEGATGNDRGGDDDDKRDQESEATRSEREARARGHATDLSLPPGGRGEREREREAEQRVGKWPIVEVGAAYPDHIARRRLKERERDR